MRIGRIGALLLAAALLAGCRAPEEPPAASPTPEPAGTAEPPPRDPNWPVQIGDAVLEASPGGVVSLNPSVTEILFDLGLGDKLLGVSDYCAYPPQAAEKQRCGSELLPDAQAVLGSGAGAVMALHPLPGGAAQALAEGGVAVLVLDKPDAFDALPAYWADIARAVLGEEDGRSAAGAFAAPLMGALAALPDALAGEARPSGAFAALLPLTLATPDSPQGALLALCGIDNVAADYSGWQYPEELLLPLDPALLVADARTLPLDEVRAHPNYKTTACVRDGRLLAVDGGAIENGGRRLFETMLEIARLAHPDASLPSLEGPGGGAEEREG